MWNHLITMADLPHLWLICTRFHSTHFVFMTLANVPLLQMWPELGAVSHCNCIYRKIRCGVNHFCRCKLCKLSTRIRIKCDEMFPCFWWCIFVGWCQIYMPGTGWTTGNHQNCWKTSRSGGISWREKCSKHMECVSPYILYVVSHRLAYIRKAHTPV